MHSAMTIATHTTAARQWAQLYQLQFRQLVQSPIDSIFNSGTPNLMLESNCEQGLMSASSINEAVTWLAPCTAYPV